MARIPAQATCVFEGEIFSVWQWPQQMYDGTTATFEMIKRPDTVQVIAMQDEDIFFARQQQPDRAEAYFSLFGGRVEKGEDPLEAAKRELLEEAGLAADSWELLWEEEPSHKMDWRVLTFIAKGCRQVGGQTLDAGEKVEILRCPMSEFLTKVMPQPTFGEVNVRRRLANGAPDPAKMQELMKKAINE